jgi:integrase
VRTVYTVLRAALDVAVRDGLLRRNPAAVVRRPTVARRDATYLTAEEAHQLLEATRGNWLEPLFRLMLATGLRRGEALALHWADVDLDAGQLPVRWLLSIDLSTPPACRTHCPVYPVVPSGRSWPDRICGPATG